MRLSQPVHIPGLVCVLVVTSLLLFQSSSTIAERLPIKTYTTADGLPRDRVNRVVQDSKGFLWFCTTEGLSRFDGYKFTNYGIDQGLPARQVNDFLESRSGDYWVATDKGLCRFIPDPSPRSRGDESSSRKRFAVYYPGEDTGAQLISTIYEDHLGTIWCGTFLGLFRLDKAGDEYTFSFVDIIRSAVAADLFVRAITEDRKGSLWVGTESAVYRRRPDGVVERYATEEGFPGTGNGRAIVEGRDGRMWIGTSHGLYRLISEPAPRHPIVSRIYTTKDGLVPGEITALFQASNGKLWVGSLQGISECLLTDHEARIESYTSDNGLSSGGITSISEDRDHNLWIGTFVGGAIRLSTNGFTSYFREDGLAGTSIATIFENRAGEICVVNNSSSINHFIGRRFKTTAIATPKGLSYWGWGWYQTTFQDSAGEWWVPTGQGLIRYPKVDAVEQLSRTRPTAFYTTKNGLPANDIFRLFEDSHGDIWISTLSNPNGVLSRWERVTNSFHRYTPANGIPTSAPTAFCEDASGNIWIGFYLGGLLRYAAGHFTVFGEPEGMPGGLVRGIYRDHQNRLWIATANDGVVRIDDPSIDRPVFITYSTAQGLSSSQATCILEDQWGMIYIGTGRGVDKLNPQTGHVRHYTTEDGLANSFINVGFRQRDGSLWFGTLDGLSRFIPQPDRPVANVPIVITNLLIKGVSFPISELGAENLVGPEVGASDNHIQIDFVGLNVGSGETVRYQFKLEGADSDWSAPSDQRSVNYPNLPSGSYQFLVRALTAGGMASERPASVSFRVLPPIWKRWWFVLSAFFLISIPILAVARSRYYRVKAVREAEEAVRRSREERLLELEQVRRRIATDLHDDVGSTLSQIFLLSEVARQRVVGDHADVLEPLTMISSASNEVVSSMSDIVWAINPQKDHLSDLVHRMRRFASDTFAARDIAFYFKAPDTQTDLRLGANLRREVFLIFKECINNLTRHSRCTEAQIEFHIGAETLMLRVSDNGKGFDADKRGDGHGLGSMRERANSIGGQFTLESRPGNGTTITLIVPLAPTLSSHSSDGTRTSAS